jgi:uncharacterized protein
MSKSVGLLTRNEHEEAPIGRPWPRRLALLSGGLLVLGTVAALLAGSLLSRPVQHPVGAPPPDLRAEAVVFPSPSGTRLHGWFSPGRPGGGAVLLLHGVHTDRRSMLARARLLHRAGYAVLLVDFQAHGESPGRRITFGWLESRDAAAAAAYLRHRAPGERLGVVAVSMGGAAALLAGAALDADALVLESVYPTFREAVADRLRARLGALGPPAAPLLTWQMRPRLGISPDVLRPIDSLRTARVPVFLLTGAADTYTPLAEARRLYAVAPGPKWFLAVPGAGHEDLDRAAPAVYRRYVLGFLDRYVRRRQAS